jgi:hypothetical protein
MSDTLIRIIPALPAFIPTAEAIELARCYLQTAVPSTLQIELTTFDSVQFIDAGQHFDGVTCPACGEDAMVWWGDAMSESAETGFTQFTLSAPCCGKTVSLDNLKYASPVGFASFCIELAYESNYPLKESDIIALQSMLGCEIKVIDVLL